MPATVGPIHSNPVTPTTTSVSLPVTSPIHDSPSSSHSLSSSPPSRRPRPKSRESLVPPPTEAGSPGLVNYLKQMHGLTKKRTHGGKAVKKSATAADVPRTSTSRPILPRLELPPAHLAANDLKGKATEIAALEAASAGNSRYAPIAPAISPNRTPPEEARRAVPRRWPWIQPAPLTSSVAEGPSLSPSTSAALRSLQTIAPRVPELSTQLPGEQLTSTRSKNGSASDAPPSRSGSTVSARPQTHRPATMPPYGIHSASQSDDLAAHPAYRHMSNDHHYTAGDMAYPSQARSPVVRQQSSVERTYQAHQQHAQYNTYQYSSQPTYLSETGHVSPPLPSPSPSHPGPSPDQDSENQPFLISAEYEAMANAEFEEAVRSGAMQASMTPTVLSPVASSPVHGSAGYFALDPAPTSAMMPSTMQQTPTVSQARPSYSYTQPHESQLGHDILYNQTQASGAESRSTPPSNMGYYSPPPGDDRDEHRWYGA